MGTERLGLGLILTIAGGALIFTAFAMNTGDGMFGGITERAPIGILSVVMFIPGITQIIRGLRGRAIARNHAKLISTPVGRQTALVRQLADLDQQLVEAESLAAEPGDDETLERARKALTELREARREMEEKLAAGQ